MSTREFSNVQESAVAQALNGKKTSGSGAGRFEKGDVIVPDANLLVECKTVMSEKASVSIRKQWLEKVQEEAFENRLEYSALAFNFGPGEQSYYVIDERLMKFLTEMLHSES